MKKNLITSDQRIGPQRLMALMALLALCLTPAFGSAALLLTAFITLIAMPLALIQCGRSAIRAKHLLAGSLLAYFFYFLLVDFLISGNFRASLYTMAPNLPLLAVAVIALALDPERARLSANRIGTWASLAVLVSFVMAAAIWLVQPNWQIFGTSLIRITGVNDRLMLLAGNPLLFAAAYMTLGYVALLGWHDRSATSRGFAIAALVIALATVAFWSQSRGATLVALPLSLLSIFYVRPRPVTLLVVTLGVFAIMALIIILGGFDERVLGSFKRLTRGLATVLTGDPSMESSTGFRLIMYRAGIAAWMESPVWGYGVTERFSAIIPYLPEGYTFRFSHLHNTFLTHAVAGGVVGVAFLLMLLFTPAAINIIDGPPNRDQRYLAWVILISLSGVGMSSLILNQDVSSHFLALLMIVHLFMHHDKTMKGISSPSGSAPLDVVSAQPKRGQKT
jgi:O-antigen ligase